MSKIRVATCVPKQQWTVKGKLDWLDAALARTPCDLFLLPQEYFGGGSCREICRLKGIETDDFPVTFTWLGDKIGLLAEKYNVHIGVGATVNRDGVCTEDYVYIDNKGFYAGHHSKIALPVQDSIVTNGNSGVTPESDPVRASTVIKLPALGLRVGTVFCWQVFFNDCWQRLADQKCNLVVHPIKFAPRAWYQKGRTQDDKPTRIGFTQNAGSDNPANDELGWIRKLLFESEFKELPIAVTCNTWSGGEEFLALSGFVDETTQHTKLFHTPSTAEAEMISVHEYDPTLYAELEHLSLAVYAQFKDVWPSLMRGTMRRKAVRLEKRSGTPRTVAKIEFAIRKDEGVRSQLNIFED